MPNANKKAYLQWETIGLMQKMFLQQANISLMQNCKMKNICIGRGQPNANSTSQEKIKLDLGTLIKC